MWCANCKTDHDSNITVCPDCGEPLLDMPEAIWGLAAENNRIGDWPADDNGDPVAPAFLAHRSGVDMDDVMLVNMLDAYEFPCLIIDSKNSRFDKLIFGTGSGGTDIYVPETMLDDAIELIREVENEQDGL